MTPTTVSESFIKWMEDNGYGTFNEDIFLNQVPDIAVDNAFWVVTAGGNVVTRLVTAQNIQRFITQINYRNISGKEVERTLFALNQKINARNCFNIDGFTLYDISATMPTDNDRDAENRRQGSFTVTIDIYKSYVN